MEILEVKAKDLYEFDKNLKEDNLYYAIFFHNRIFGYISLKVEKQIILEYIYIKEEFRNSSYGSKLLNFAIFSLANKAYNEIRVLNHKKIDNFLEKNDFINIDGIYIRKNIKEEIENINITLKVSSISIILNILLSILKLSIGFIFSINTFIADGINSFSDLINNILILIAANISKNHSDEDHPYGHEKVESIFSLIVGIVIILFSLNVIKTSFIDLFLKDSIYLIEKNILNYSILFILIKLIQYIYVYLNYRKSKNELLKVLILDYNFDLLLSFVIFLNLIIYKYISFNSDALLSLFISFYLIYQGYKIIKDNIEILMDSQDEKLLLSIKAITLEIKEIENIHDIYMSRIGKKIYVVADIRINGNISLEKAHEISIQAEKKVRFRHANIKKIVYHIEPTYCEE